MFYAFFGAALYAIKGGQLSYIFNFLKEKVIPVRALNCFIGYKHYVSKFFNGLNLSTALMFALTLNPWIALAWNIGNRPSVGEIISGIGGYKGNWYRNVAGNIIPYPPVAKRSALISASKLAVQRGVFLGACLALASGNTAFIVAGALYPSTIWLGNSVQQYAQKRVIVPWVVHEWLFGAVIGAAFLA